MQDSRTAGSLEKQAPPLTLPTDRGESFDLADHRDRPVLVTFLSHGG